MPKRKLPVIQNPCKNCGAAEAEMGELCTLCAIELGERLTAHHKLANGNTPEAMAYKELLAQYSALKREHDELKDEIRRILRGEGHT